MNSLPCPRLPVGPQGKISELLPVHGRRGIGQRTGRLLGFGKGDDIADGIAAGQDHHQPVNAESDAAVGRRPNSRARSRKPNFSCASAGSMPSTAKTFSCTSRR